MKFEIIKLGSLIVNVGKCGLGKIFLIRNILYELCDKVKLIVVFLLMEDVNGFYKDFVLDVFIYIDFDMNWFKNIYEE